MRPLHTRSVAKQLTKHLLPEDVVYVNEDDLDTFILELMADAITDGLNESQLELVKADLRHRLTKIAAPAGVTGRVELGAIESEPEWEWS